MEQYNLKVQLDEKVYNAFWQHILNMSNGNEMYAKALMSMLIESMMSEQIN